MQGPVVDSSTCDFEALQPDLADARCKVCLHGVFWRNCRHHGGGMNACVSCCCTLLLLVSCSLLLLVLYA
jgi:hypothetical protein